MKSLVLSAIVLMMAITAFAQPRPDSLWARTFGGASTDVAEAIRPTLDGNYIVAGTTQSFGEDDIYLIKLNPQGDTLWTRVLDFNNAEQANTIWPTSDGGYLLGGSILYMDMGNQALLLVKTNGNGDTLWTKAYSAGWTNYATVIKPTSDNGFIVAGTTTTETGDNNTYLLKINSSGDTSWTRTFGNAQNNELMDIASTTDGGYIMGGYSWVQNQSQVAYAVKTDALGHPQWIRNYEFLIVMFNHVQQAADGSYLFVGCGAPASTMHLGGFLMKTDSAGTTQWTQIHSVSPLDEIIYAAQRTSDGGYILVGAIGNLDSALIGMQITRMDSAGNALWDHMYGAGTGAQARAVMETTDHSYILAGLTETPTNGTDALVLRTGVENTTLISPLGGTSIAIGLPVEILWNGSIHGGNVALEINRTYPSATWETISASTPNNGHFSWTVTGTESNHARLRIRHLTNTLLSDTTAADFHVRIPRLQLIWPNGGETVLSGVRDTVRFERIVTTGNLRLSVNRGYPAGTWEPYGTGIAGDSTAFWIVQLPGGPHCRLRISSETDTTIFDISDADFTIRAPQMALTAPTAGEQVTVGVAYTILWSATEHNGNFRLSLNRNYPTGTWESITLNARNTGRFNWTPSAPPSDHCRLRLTTLLDPQSFVESAADFSIIASGAAEPPAELPTVFALHTPYPNPFNAQTTLTFDLPRDGNLRLVIFDITGRLVATVAQGPFPAGQHQILFDASALPSGLYIAKMEAANLSFLQKMVLLK